MDVHGLSAVQGSLSSPPLDEAVALLEDSGVDATRGGVSGLHISRACLALSLPGVAAVRRLLLDDGFALVVSVA